MSLLPSEGQTAGGSGFSLAIFLAGWAGGQPGGRAQLPRDRHPPPQHTHSHNLYPNRSPPLAHPTHTAGGGKFRHWSVASESLWASGDRC